MKLDQAQRWREQEAEMSADGISHVIPGPAQRRIGTGERGVGGVLGAILGNGEKPLFDN